MIISFSGTIGCGKDYCGKLIRDRIEPDVGWRIKKWAGKLKEIGSILSGVPIEMWEDQDFKRLTMTSGWGDMTYRQFLQKLGTEALRDNLHKDVWVNALMSEYFPISQCDKTGYIYPNWLITDTRFGNEVKAVKRLGGTTVRVVRTCAECGYLRGHKSSCKYYAESRHESETLLDYYTFDYVIENVGNDDDLIENLTKLLEYVRDKENRKERV
jgi:hypothetical protein